MARIAIQPDRQLLMSGRHQSFSSSWSERLAASGHEARSVSVFEPDFFDAVRECDGFMWWFAHLPFPRNVGKRVLPAIEHGMGIPVFPSWETIWHFDDKIAQQYLLEAAGIPVPRTHVFWTSADALRFCATASYPLVIKLASGITSENVALVKSVDDARYWVDRMFDGGTVDLQRTGLPARPREVARRVYHAGRLLLQGRIGPLSSRTDLQRGYLLLQEFLDGNVFDTRVTVIGNRAFAFRRFNRPDDFRASGSGRIDWTAEEIAQDVVRLAFRVARTLGTQSIAVDVLRRAGLPVINEISYYYEGWAVADCPGHWRLAGEGRAGDQLEWVNGRLRPEDAILADFMSEIAGTCTATVSLRAAD
jgi:hypothetical protein